MTSIFKVPLFSAETAGQGLDLPGVLRAVIDSQRYVLGTQVLAFEAAFAAYVGVRHAIGVANGTDALEIALRSLGVKPGEGVVTVANAGFYGSTAIRAIGAQPLYVDVDEYTLNLSPSALAQVLSIKPVKAVIATHLYGQLADMAAITDLCRAAGVALIEDCAQAHGARRAGRLAGAWGDVACFSFYPTKNLGGLGDGGAVITNDDALAERLKHVRNYGSSKKYVNRYVGVNSRLDELQAAALRVKLRHLDTITTHKRQLADLYFRRLNSVVQLPACHQDEFDVFHIFAIRHPDRDRLRTSLMEAGVHTEIHYPIAPHRQDALKDIIKNTYPVSERIHQTILSLPISVGHTEADIEKVIDTMLAVI